MMPLLYKELKFLCRISSRKTNIPGAEKNLIRPPTVESNFNSLIPEERLEDIGHKLLQDGNIALTSLKHKSGYY